jgi:hypothetical protein
MINSFTEVSHPYGRRQSSQARAADRSADSALGVGCGNAAPEVSASSMRTALGSGLPSSAQLTKEPPVAERYTAISCARGLDACLPCGGPDCQLFFAGLLLP